jgi:hypothetical protein
MTFWFLPRLAPGVAEISVSRSSSAANAELSPVISDEEKQQQALFNERYTEFSRALEELESQAAGVWGGESFGAAKSMGELALAASSTRDLSLALDRLSLATQRLTRVANGQCGDRRWAVGDCTSVFGARIVDRSGKYVCDTCACSNRRLGAAIARVGRGRDCTTGVRQFASADFIRTGASCRS